MRRLDLQQLGPATAIALTMVACGLSDEPVESRDRNGPHEVEVVVRDGTVAVPGFDVTMQGLPPGWEPLTYWWLTTRRGEIISAESSWLPERPQDEGEEHMVFTICLTQVDEALCQTEGEHVVSVDRSHKGVIASVAVLPSWPRLHNQADLAAWSLVSSN